MTSLVVTYECLDIESLGGLDSLYALLRECTKNGGFTSVIEAED